ncbi:hypothetical protein Vretimale_13341 [Volvox reticuliferus]|uniref:Uncharacterized protein n=1 Tax=Volvox reticuliferus TaxID=1737510 RepID=A0A8J4GK18_9CHLO|nr:hypothetical protein Vretimale_13341 [Volvox reticuliferus]
MAVGVASAGVVVSGGAISSCRDDECTGSNAALATPIRFVRGPNLSASELSSSCLQPSREKRRAPLRLNAAPAGPTGAAAGAAADVFVFVVAEANSGVAPPSFNSPHFETPAASPVDSNTSHQPPSLLMSVASGATAPGSHSATGLGSQWKGAFGNKSKSTTTSSPSASASTLSTFA